MCVYTVADLRVLAIAYCRGVGIAPRSLGPRMGLNNRIFARIVDEGQGCRAESAEAASKWFDENWPTGVRWPLNRQPICPVTGNLRCSEPYCQGDDDRCYLRDKAGSLDHPAETPASEPVPS